MDNPAALPPPGHAPHERSALATRLFQDEMAIPVHLNAAASSDTDNSAMVDVGGAPFTNSINQVDHWDQLIADGNCPEVVARMKDVDVDADGDAYIDFPVLGKHLKTTQCWVSAGSFGRLVRNVRNEPDKEQKEREMKKLKEELKEDMQAPSWVEEG